MEAVKPDFADTHMMPSLKSYEDLRREIARRHADLSDRLQRIAKYAVDHPDDIALNTVSTLASEIGVQPSSIVRFANAFGFGGFSEMQQIFRSRLVADASSGYRARIASARRVKSPENSNDPVAVLTREVDADIASLQELGQSADRALLRRAIALMSNAGTIYIAAQGRSFPVAFYLAYALGRLEVRSHLIDGIGGLNKAVAQTAAPNDVLIAISFRDYSPDIVGVVDTACERHVPIIAITDSPLSPIAAPAKVSFEIRSATEDRPFRSLVAPMALSQALVVALGHHLTSEQR
jgi:DNA-binding MurR/RpiR family transcriptional regulator